MVPANPRRVQLLAGNSHPALAEQLGRELRLPVSAAEVGSFADGETRVHVGQDVRDAVVLIVQPTGPPVNDHLMVLALLADAVRAAGAARVVGVVPYLGYARQEVRGRPGDPRSAQVVGRLLAGVGLDHLVTLDLHAPALESALPMPATLMAAGAASRIRAGKFVRVLTSDSIPFAAGSWMEVVPVAPLLARTARYLCGEGVESVAGQPPKVERELVR